MTKKRIKGYYYLFVLIVITFISFNVGKRMNTTEDKEQQKNEVSQVDIIRNEDRYADEMLTDILNYYYGTKGGNLSEDDELFLTILLNKVAYGQVSKEEGFQMIDGYTSRKAKNDR